MKVYVDETACVAAGMCTACAPTVFRLDDALDTVMVLMEHVPPDLEAGVQDAEACCPVSAIRTSNSVSGS